ncbi:hypothetical protein [Larkinella ripae]
MLLSDCADRFSLPFLNAQSLDGFSAELKTAIPFVGDVPGGISTKRRIVRQIPAKPETARLNEKNRAGAGYWSEGKSGH